MLSDLIYRLRALFRRNTVERDLEDELRFHIENETAARIARGADSTEAVRQARIAFGGVEQTREACREARGVSLLLAIFRDLRFALRMLVRTPGFTAVAILTLALGIGANTAIFSAVKAILLRPLPYRDADRLVMVWEANPSRDWHHNIVSAANFQDWKNRNHVFTDMAAFLSPTLTLTGEGDPVEITGEQSTPNLLSVLGVSPILGRAFTPEEGRPGGPRVALIAFTFWQNQFAGAKDVLGRGIGLNGQSYRIIGVLPPGFDGCESCFGHRPQIWISGLDTHPQGRIYHSFRVVARLRPGVTVDRALTEMRTLADAITREDSSNIGWTVEVVGVRDDSVRIVAPAIEILFVAAFLVLLIACVNLANVLLARSSARQREIGVRGAMGAGRTRIVAQLIAENLLLALGGGTLGVVLAIFLTRLLRAFAPAEATPGLANVGVNGVVLAYSLGLVIVTTLFFGLAPAILSARRDLNDVLKQTSRSTGGSGGHRLRGILVSAEVALAMVLVTSAALMISSVARLSRVPLGFDPTDVIAMRVPLRGQVYRDNPQRVAAVLTELVRRVNTLPGVEHASVTRGVPTDGWDGEDFVTAENPDPPPGQSPDGNYVVVSPSYFDLMRIPLLRGRAFLESDVQNSRPVAIVNEELAREFWPHEDPLGKRLHTVPVPPNAPWMTVVGIAANVETQGPTNAAHPEIFVPVAQYPWAITPRELLVRAVPNANTAAIVAGIRKQLRALDPSLPISDVRSLEAVVGESVLVQRFLTWLLAAFGALSLLLAGLGVYGVLSYAVSLRTQEIGLRMALGAGRGDVLSHVILRGVALGFAGIAAGAAGALSLTGFLRSQLYRTGPRDPVTFVVVPVVLLIVTLSASYIPARRATAVDPMTALRCE